MQNNKLLENYINRATALKKNKLPEISQETIHKVQLNLELVLPEDFKFLGNAYGYDFCRRFEFLSFRDNDGVINTTLEWRKNINLPHNYIVLADDGTSAILMKVDGDSSQVIWCSLEDVLRMCNGEEMIYDPTIFPTFTDFYAYLLDEEEKIRNEQH